MRKILILFSLFSLQLMSNHVVLADALTSDQIEIKTLIKKMYVIDPDTFEYANFGGEYKNGRVVIEGKYDPKRQCQLFAEFLVKEAIIKEKGVNQGCMTGVDGHFRYPTFDSMDLGSATRVYPLQKPQIKSPVVDGDKAKVYVKLKGAGDVFYYLRKMPEGWRIYRVEARESGENEDHIELGDTVSIFPPEN